MNDEQTPQPLNGLRVVEFTHMVMGPTCGMVLADMGAEVIKVEPIDGDRTRFLLGAGAGFFPMFNRNKKSIAIDLRNEGRSANSARARGQRRRRAREFQAEHDAQVRTRLCDAVEDESAADLRRPQGFSARTRTNIAPRSTKSCR